MSAYVNTAEAPASPTITANDRCDTCHAEAMVRVTMGHSGCFYLCGHHYAAIEDKLNEKALAIEDERAIKLVAQEA